MASSSPSRRPFCQRSVIRFACRSAGQRKWTGYSPRRCGDDSWQRFPVESYSNPQRDRIEKEIQNVTPQILIIQRRMAAFQASYNALIARCTAATQQYKRYLSQQNARRKQVSRELIALERQLTHNDNPSDRSIDAKRAGNLSKSFNEYFTYPLEQRRQELLSSIGCGDDRGGGY